MAKLTELCLFAGPSVDAAPITAAKFAPRFWRKVDQSGGASACWPWRGNRVRSGRGQVHVRMEGKKHVRRYAPVIAWELTYGPVPDGQRVCHNCPAGDNPNCCNPSHLFLGTQADNVRDSILKARRNAFGIQKLHPPQVREIRELARTGLSYQQIAARFNVAKSTVRHIVARRSWGWLTDESALDQVFERVPSVQLPVVGEVR